MLELRLSAKEQAIIQEIGKIRCFYHNMFLIQWGYCLHRRRYLGTFLVFVWWLHHTLYSTVFVQVLSFVWPWFCHCRAIILTSTHSSMVRKKKFGSSDSLRLFKIIGHSTWLKAPLCREILRLLTCCYCGCIWLGKWRYVMVLFSLFFSKSGIARSVRVFCLYNCEVENALICLP